MVGYNKFLSYYYYNTLVTILHLYQSTYQKICNLTTKVSQNILCSTFVWLCHLQEVMGQGHSRS